jgi:Nucleotidyltransferase/DNA polymerase involved in DNA repair
MSLRLGSRDPVEIATRLKDEIKSRLGFTVNVGVGPNKLLAKMASDFEKPDKVHTLWEHEIREKMWPLGVRDLLWVGKKTEERLVAYGVHTIGDLARLSVGQLTRIVGQKFAAQLHENANGRDDSPVETEIQEAKSYSAERTFPKDLSDPKDIDRALFNVACIVAHRIRRDGFRASTVSMFVKYTDFSVAQKQCQTGQPTDITAVILNEARRMLAEVWDGVTPLRQVGLGVSKLTHETVEQMSLFEDPKMEYYREWDRQYDAARAQAEDARLLAYERKSAPQSPDSPQASAPTSTPAVSPSTEDPTAPTYVVLREVTAPSAPAEAPSTSADNQAAPLPLSRRRKGPCRREERRPLRPLPPYPPHEVPRRLRLLRPSPRRQAPRAAHGHPIARLREQKRGKTCPQPCCGTRGGTKTARNVSPAMLERGLFILGNSLKFLYL